MDQEPGTSRIPSPGPGDSSHPAKYPHNPEGVYEMVAKEYLAKHKILEFFENLTAALVFEQPEDPKAFAMEFIQKLQESKSDPEMSKPPSLVTTSNIESIFGMLDVTKAGYISLPQYRQAMASLGLKSFNPSPSGADFNKISLPTFMRESKTAIEHASATYGGTNDN